MEDALELELEALTATYADDVTIETNQIDGKCPVIVTFQLAPRAVESHDAYVASVMRVRVPHGYPDVSPWIELLDTKGIGDQRLALLSEALRAEASALQGELALGALCEHALDWMTEENRPEGMVTTDATQISTALCQLSWYCWSASRATRT
jgi:hypothetical protein